MRDDLLEWADAYFVGQLGLLKRKTFGCPSYYLGRKMFAFLYEDSLGIKADPGMVERKIAENSDIYDHFNPGDGVMGNWLMITYPEAEDYEAEREWIEECLRRF